MLIAAIIIIAGLLVVLACMVGLVRDFGALAHDLMDPTQRAKLRPPLAPDTFSVRMIRWLVRQKTRTAPALLSHARGVFRNTQPPK